MMNSCIYCIGAIILLFSGILYMEHWKSERHAHRASTCLNEGFTNLIEAGPDFYCTRTAGFENIILRFTPAGPVRTVENTK